jgi:hypothetical protein
MTEVAVEPRAGVAVAWSPGRLIVNRAWQLGMMGALVAAVEPIRGLVGLEPRSGRYALIAALAEAFVMVFVGAVFVGLAVLAAWDRPPELSIGPDGLVLAAWDRDAVYVPWSAVVSVGLRGRWPRWLDVEVSDVTAVVLVDRGGGRPRHRWRRPRRLTMEAGLLRGGPDAVLAEVCRNSPM